MFEDLRTALSKRDKKPKEWRKFLQGGTENMERKRDRGSSWNSRKNRLS